MVLIAPARLVSNGPAIRAIRLAMGWRTGDFALAVDISQPYLSNIEAGRKAASAHVLRRIADTLCVPLAAITSQPPRTEPAPDTN